MVCFSSATFLRNRRFPFLKVLHFLDLSKHALHLSVLVAGAKSGVAAAYGSAAGVETEVGTAGNGEGSTSSRGQISKGGEFTETESFEVLHVDPAPSASTCSWLLGFFTTGWSSNVDSASCFN